MPQKTCSKCKIPKALTEYQKNPSMKDGYRSACRACRSQKGGAQAADAATAKPDALASMAAFGTPLEKLVAEAIGAHGDLVAAAASLNMTPVAVRAHLRELAARAAKRGWSPDHDMTKTVPDGYGVKGVSTMYDGDGNIRAQWVKTSRDQEHQLEALFAAVATIAEPFRGASEPAEAPTHADADLMAAYIMGDPHVGMFSWARETGNDFDTSIAERDLITAVDHLVDVAPPAATALIVNLGDFYHGDNSMNRTARSGNSLDIDTRYSKVLAIGIRIMRRIIDRALEKHERVKVITEIGNHDDNSALMLALCLASYYEREPRVEIDTSPAKFHWHRFGSNLIGVTHGDTVKAHALPGVMSVDRAKDWGETANGQRVFYTGHVHHDSAKDYPGVTVETFRTLAPADAWHAAAGYRSARDMKCDVWHREDGRIARHTIGISQVRRLQTKGEK